MSFVLGNAKGSPILPWLLSLVQQGNCLSRGWGQHSHGVVSSAEVAPGRGAVLRKANLPICPHPCAALLLVQPAEAGREGLDQRRGRLAFPRGGEGKYIGTDMWKAGLSEGLGEAALAPTRLGAQRFCTVQSHVTQAVQPTGRCRALVRAKGEAPLFSQGTTNCSAPGRKRHQIQ